MRALMMRLVVTAAKLPPHLDRSVIALRLKAARCLAGHTTSKSLADAIAKTNVGGFSWPKLRSIEAGTIKKLPEQRDLDFLAEFCGLPPAWFYVADVRATLKATLKKPDPAELVEQEVAAAARSARSKRGSSGSTSRARGDRK